MHLKSFAIGVLFSVPAFGVVTVIPMGDSITNGVGSSDMGGYRLVVKNNLGNQIDFLGRRNDGPFADNQDEGWGGFTVKKVREEVLTTIPQNSGFGKVMLITAGTNDFVWTENPTIDGAATRANAALGEMFDLLDLAFDMSRTMTVFVSTIPAIRDWFHPQNTYTYPEVDMFNAGLPDLVSEFRLRGFDARFADTTSTLDLQADFADGVHPDDSGYAKIGSAWTNALNSVLPEPSLGAMALVPLAIAARRRRR